MNIRPYLFSILFSALCALTLQAQTDVWPVQVSGSMLPPYSLNLKVYSLERAEDLSFNVMLRDPVQANLLVRPVITIEQNGSIIYQTDPNYAGKTILLSQFDQMLLNGAGLGEYLSNTALIGATANSTGSIEVPEGFNQICLQMYGVERNVPVSNKFCISGNFRLSQPPQIVKPSFNEKIKMPEVQNFVFSWQPMHIGSPNNPGPVEYTFELVELPMGVMNANDGFASALRVYSTKTMATSFIYTQGEPTLEPNKYYAWRVTATSVMYPTSKLFQNDGKGEVSVFVLYDGDEPGGDVNPFDKASPRGCSVYETSYGPVSKADNAPVIAAPNQNVKVGYFDMKITEAYGSQQQGYTGKGLVEYPMLRSVLEVEFKNIKVNNEGRVYEAESITSIIDSKLKLTPEQLKANVIASNLTGSYAKTLYQSIKNANKVSLLSEGNLKKNALPLALQNEEFPTTMMAVTDIRFTPTNAYLTLIGLDNAENVPAKNIQASDLTISAATAIPSTPFGIKNGTYLVPITNTSSANNVNLTATIMKAVSMDSDSRIYCDCNGYKKPQTKEDLYLSDDIVAQASNGQPLKIAVKDGKQPIASYNGDVKAFPEFTVKGVESYTFKSEGGALNLDPSKTLNGLPSSGTSTSPKKLWLQKVTTQLPAKYNIGSSGVVKLSGDMVIGEDDLEYGYFKKSDILPLNKGVIEKWNYSIDEMSMKLEGKKMAGPTLSGKVKLPVSSQTFDYSGTFIDNSRNPVLYVDKLPETLPIEMWSGFMALKPVSSLGLEIKKINEENTVYPNAALTGIFGMQMDKNTFKDAIKGNIAQTKEDMKKVFNLSSDDMDFGVSGIDIENWSFEPYTTKDNKYIPTNLDVSEAKFQINGKSYPITSGEIVYNTDSKERLGLSFTTVAGNNRISFTIWAVEKDGKFVFDGIEENSFELKCDCDTGNAIGMVDYDKIYDDIIRTRFMPHLNNTKHHGGTSSYTDGMSMADVAMYQTYKATLAEETYDGFILVNPTTLRWPLLKKDLKVSSSETGIFLENDLVLTPGDLKNLGFKTDVWIPEHYQLVISELIIRKANVESKKATLKFKLLPGATKSETFQSTYNFASDALPVSGKAITIADVKLKLGNSHIYASEGIFWEGSNSRANVGGSSHAILDCTHGLSQINLFGILVVSEILGRDSIMCMNLEGNQLGIPIQASIENVKGRSFENFIATVKNNNLIKGKNGEQWGMMFSGQPHIIIKPGETYEIYFDHHSGKDVEGFSAADYGLTTDGKSFQGIVFKKFETEVKGFEITDGKPLTLPSSNAVLFTGTVENRGFYYKHVSKNLVSAKDSASFSGWKYTLDSLTFTFKASVLTQNVTITGGMNLPLFKQNPVAHPKKKFDKGIATFKGEIIYDKGQLKNTLGFLDLNDKVFQSVLVPGMAMQLDESSKVELHYENGKWMPFGIFSGKCDFYMDHNVALSLNVISVPGMDVSTSKIDFENIVVSSFEEGIDEPIKIKLDGDAVCYVDLGSWGESGGGELAEIDAVEDFGNRTKQISSFGSKSKDNSSASKTKDSKSKDKSSANKSKKSSHDKVGENEPSFMGFDLVYNVLGPKKRDGKVVMGFKLGVGLMGANTQKTDEGEETSAMFIRAEGVMGLEYGPQSKAQDIWKFDGVTLECLAVEGKLGPVGFAGGLNILRSDEEYGSGLKGYLSAEIDGLGGMNIVGQFGKKKNNDKEFYYGFLDVEAFMEQGIPLPPPTPINPPVIDFFGLGGGIAINMKTKDVGTNLFAPENANDKKAGADAVKAMNMPNKAEIAKKNKEAEDRKAKIEAAKSKKSDDEALDFCEDIGSDLMKPGVGLMQAYTPEQGTFGGNFFAIFGPYQPSPKPPYTFVADAGIAMEINVDPETNDFTFGYIAIKARGYVMPASIGSRRDNNLGDIYSEVKFDWRNKSLDAEVSFRTKFATPKIGPIDPITIFEAPKDYDNTDFATRKNYNTGRLRLSFNPDNPYASLKLGGPNTGGLNYLSAGGFTLPSIYAYIQAGAYVDAPPALEDMIPELASLLSAEDKKERAEALEKERPEKKEFGSTKETGIAFGLKLEKLVNANYLLLHADLKLKLGFDANLRQYNDVTCGNSGVGKIGMNGWYAKGKAYAYAKGSIDMGFRLFGADLTTPVFNASAYVAMEAMGPNPTYFRGIIGGQYNVLDGMFSGDFQYKVVLGEQCEEEVYPDPIADLKIFASSSVANGQKDVDRYSDITLRTNIPLRKDYTLTQKNGEGNASHTVNFMADATKINVTQGGKPVVNSFKLNPDAKSLDISFNDVLEPMTEYTIDYEFGWKVKEGGDEDGYYVDRDKPEKGSIKFTTGARPTVIFDGMIEYSAPGNRQRYWHKGYADTEIKFKLKALSDAVSLFPEECKDCGTDPVSKKPIKYKYVARLQEFDASGNKGKTYDYPIANYPGKGENAKIYTPESKSIDGKYSINYMAEKSVPVSKVSFPDLKNADLKKGVIYELIIVRELALTLPNADDANYKRVKKMMDDNSSVLKSFYFGTSQYNSLSEKLGNLEVKHISSQLKLRDFSHPNDIFDSERASVVNMLGESKFHSVKDDYYTFTINNRKSNEGFDKFDILKMKQNIKLEYNQDYLPERYISQLQTNEGMQPDLKKFLEGGNIVGRGYLKKVLFDHTKAEEKGMINFGDQKVSDGTKWHYRISGSTDNNRSLLSDGEIKSKKVSNPTGVFSTKNDPNSNQTVFSHDIRYDFLLQDLRSRIVINQLYWLSRLSHDVTNYRPNMTYVRWHEDYWDYKGNYYIGKRGEFVNNDGSRDFSWIETVPSGMSVKAGTKDKAYIASEPGYRLSYHGTSTISFPSDDTWGELTESRRDKGVPMKNLRTFEPSRSISGTETWPVNNVNELSTDEWYKINYYGKDLGVKHFDNNVVFYIWGLNSPTSTDQAAQYELYTPAYGVVGVRKFEYIEEYNRSNTEYTWNFTNSNTKTSIINKRYKGENDKNSSWFPYMLPSYDSYYRNLVKDLHKKNDPNYMTNDVVLSEMNYKYFSPEKVYTIYQGNTPLKDGDGCSEWKIIREGRFYRLISTRGNYLRGERYDPWGPGDYRVAKSDRRTNFPGKNDGDYYKFLWNITKTGSVDGEFYINNVYYIRHFLPAKQYFHHDRKESEMSEESRVKLIIKEKK